MVEEPVCSSVPGSQRRPEWRRGGPGPGRVGPLRGGAEMRIWSAWTAVAAAFVVGCSSAPQGGESEAAALSDAEIAAVVVTANTIDAELGDLAVQRGRSASVQEFG